MGAAWLDQLESLVTCAQHLALTGQGGELALLQQRWHSQEREQERRDGSEYAPPVSVGARRDGHPSPSLERGFGLEQALERAQLLQFEA